MSTNLKEPWRSSWLWERDTEQSASTNGCHTRCTSRQLGTMAAQRYDVPRGWLWDAYLLARVCWGTCCEGFCSKEHLHYCIRWCTRNPLEQDQVQRMLERFSRSCNRTSNNQPRFTSMEIPWGFLAQPVLCRLSWGLCHVRKYKLEVYVQKERYAMQSPNGRLHQKPLAKSGNGKQTPLLRLLPGSHKHLALRKQLQCVPQTWGCTHNILSGSAQDLRKRDKKLDSRAARKGAKKLVSSNCAKILE